MAVNTLDPDSREKQDEKYNPGQSQWDDELENKYRAPAIADEDRNTGEKESAIDSPKEQASDTDSVKQAEFTPEYKYTPSRETSQPASQQWWQKNHKKKGIIGLVAGLLVGGSAGFFALLPLKVPGIMDLVNMATGRTVETVVEYRARRVIYTYLLTKGGQIPNGSRAIVTASPLGTLFANMRANGFEEKLERDYGVKIENRGGVAHLVRAGMIVPMRSDADIDRLLVNGSILKKSDIDTIIRKEIPAYRYFKSKKFAKWMRLKYGIPRYGLQNSDKKDANERKAEMRRQQLEAGNANSLARLSEFLGCLTGGTCTATDVPEPGNNTAAGQNKDETLASVQKEAIELAKKQEEELKNGGNLAALQERLSQAVISKVGVKAIPIIGWIDLAATLDHILHDAEEENWFKTIPAHYKAGAAGFVFGTFSGYGDQIKAGEMDPQYVGVLAEQMNGVEQSRAYDHLGANTGKGIPIEDGDKIDETGDIATGDKFLDYYSTVQTYTGGPGSHLILNAYYETLGGGGLLGWIGNNLGALVGKFISTLSSLILPASVEAWLEENVKHMAKLIMSLAGINIGLDAVGPQLMNYLHMGGVSSHNTYCKDELGCRKINDQQGAELERVMARDEADKLSRLSFYDRWLDSENPKSVTTQVAMSLPSNGAANGGNVANTMARLPAYIIQTPIKLVTASLSPAKLSAQTHDQSSFDMYGIERFGATENDLNQPLSQEVGKENLQCPEVDENTFNTCKADQKVIEAMLESYGVNTSPQETPTTPTTPSPGGGNLPSGTKQQLAKKIMSSGNVTGASKYMQQVSNIANGTESCNVNVVVLQLLAKISETHKVTMSSLNRYCTNTLTASGVGSYHYQSGGGHAFDLSVVDGVASSGAKPNDLTLLREIIPLLPSGSGIGQSQCRSGAAKLQLPAGIREFSDTCNHIHVQVPIQ